MAKPTTEQINNVVAAFVKVARHVRNFPHPALTIEMLRKEAVEAERLAEKVFGKREYERINDIAFINQVIQ